MKNLKLFVKLLLLCVLMTGCDNIFSTVKVITYEPENITSHSALCGAKVEKIGETIYYGELGVCWGTSPNPTIIDNLDP